MVVRLWELQLRPPISITLAVLLRPFLQHITHDLAIMVSRDFFHKGNTAA